MLPAGLIEVDRWLGLRGDALSPAAMLFVAVERDGSGCRSFAVLSRSCQNPLIRFL